MCTVTSKWGTKPGVVLVKGMVRNAYWTMRTGYRAGKIDV